MPALVVGDHEKEGDHGVGAGIWAKYKAYGGDGKLAQDTTWAEATWTLQTVDERLAEEHTYAPPFGSKAVVKGDKMCIVVPATDAARGGVQSGLEPFAGRAAGPAAEGGGKQAPWEAPRSLKSTLAGKMTRHSWEVLFAALGAKALQLGRRRLSSLLWQLAAPPMRERAPAPSCAPTTVGAAGSFLRRLWLPRAVPVPRFLSGRGSF
ncbi:trans-sialidase [Trypanosoma conorhini]|uniref:Trans-sialidase n=1 Tax=Trypanosoma conorhini TaxID=83891 RepID=A0A3S5IQP8_9TRYP|nr:trans-sialidase [Trypanosoma conorhini]RNF01601.1 trans-sialidase [Trypanosoma conorhini]